MGLIAYEAVYAAGVVNVTGVEASNNVTTAKTTRATTSALAPSATVRIAVRDAVKRDRPENIDINKFKTSTLRPVTSPSAATGPNLSGPSFESTADRTN